MHYEIIQISKYQANSTTHAQNSNNNCYMAPPNKLGFMNQYYSNPALTLPNQNAASTSFTGREISTQYSSRRKEIGTQSPRSLQQLSCRLFMQHTCIKFQRSATEIDQAQQRNKVAAMDFFSKKALGILKDVGNIGYAKLKSDIDTSNPTLKKGTVTQKFT